MLIMSMTGAALESGVNLRARSFQIVSFPGIWVRFMGAVLSRERISTAFFQRMTLLREAAPTELHCSTVCWLEIMPVGVSISTLLVMVAARLNAGLTIARLPKIAVGLSQENIFPPFIRIPSFIQIYMIPTA